ncbi:MAG TPA: hypothetical protein VN613_00905 [Gemmatimonadaceae bacterium]|nr:hypothetical protein [Gemmatimonadaceae bacterium]
MAGCAKPPAPHATAAAQTEADAVQPREVNAIAAYAIYGLTLESNVALDGLPPSPAVRAADITLVAGRTPPWADAPRRAGTVRYRTPPAQSQPDDNLVVHEAAEGFLFRYADGTEFHVAADGRNVWANWIPPLTVADMATYLVGPVMGFAQRLRGVLCLHASAVVVNGAAVALCGPSEAGKSTTAGAFASAGYEVLSDDLTALRDDGASISALPAYGHLRVWTESERILLGTAGALPRLTPSWDKRALELRDRGWKFRDTPVRLGAVVFLADRNADGRSPSVSPIAPAEAFVAMAANSYANYLLDGAMRAVEFRAIERLVQGSRLLRAVPHADPRRIGELVERIVAAVSP